MKVSRWVLITLQIVCTVRHEYMKEIVKEALLIRNSANDAQDLEETILVSQEMVDKFSLRTMLSSKCFLWILLSNLFIESNGRGVFFLNRRLLITRSLQSRRNTSWRELSLTTPIKMRWRKRWKETLKSKTQQRTISSRRLTPCFPTARRRRRSLSLTSFTILALTNCLWNYSFLSSSSFKSSVRRSWCLWSNYRALRLDFLQTLTIVSSPMLS